ncbi:hypothetical protein SALBM217S_04279 [Streptomyces griseoloalbus]
MGERGEMIGVELVERAAQTVEMPEAEGAGRLGPSSGVGLEAVTDPARRPQNAAPDLAAAVQRECLHGLMSRTRQHRRLFPPLTISDEQATAVLDRLADGGSGGPRSRTWPQAARAVTGPVCGQSASAAGLRTPWASRAAGARSPPAGCAARRGLRVKAARPMRQQALAQSTCQLVRPRAARRQPLVPVRRESLRPRPVPTNAPAANAAAFTKPPCPEPAPPQPAHQLQQGPSSKPKLKPKLQAQAQAQSAERPLRPHEKSRSSRAHEPEPPRGTRLEQPASPPKKAVPSIGVLPACSPDAGSDDQISHQAPPAPTARSSDDQLCPRSRRRPRRCEESSPAQRKQRAKLGSAPEPEP